MEYSKEFMDHLNKIEAKRAKTVIQHILKYGYITSQELKDNYGYNHPPRAIRDVREYGVPIETYRIVGNDGRKIAAYKFGNPEELKNNISKSAGRTALSKALKQALIEKYGSKCFVYLETLDESSLQVDHRVPYEIGGENDINDMERYMLLCPSANRAKSWTCENCTNWQKKDIEFCMKCFWAYPENYEHVAGVNQKIITIVFTGNEVEDYNRLIDIVGENNASETIKNIIKGIIDK